MCDSCAMCFVERLRDLDCNTKCLGNRQRTLPDAVRERLPFEILHHQVVDAVLLADVIERADIRMIQRRDRASFPLETLPKFRIAGEMLGEDFDRNCSVEP